MIVFLSKQSHVSQKWHLNAYSKVVCVIICLLYVNDLPEIISKFEDFENASSHWSHIVIIVVLLVNAKS